MPYISEQSAAQIKESANIVDVIGQYVELKRAGANLKGCCPFHNEKTPSFTVSPAKEIYKCFGCGASGDAVSFLMEHDQLSYPEALKRIADQNGITPEYDDSERAKERAKIEDKRNQLRPVLQEAIQLYIKELRKQKTTHASFKELKKRQYNKDIIDEWNIGFAPGGRLLVDYFKEKGKLDEALTLGLVKLKEEEYLDAFFNRLIYPIYDRNGLPVALAGRDLSGKSKAKWINSAESILYNKDKIWYGLHRHKKEIVKNSNAWIVEGYNDVITPAKYGQLNTIASCGTSISLEKLEALRKYCDFVTLVLDPDAAGEKAAIKTIPLAIKAGFLVYVIELPEDPDDFFRSLNSQDPKPTEKYMTNIMDHGKDAFFYYIDKVLTGDQLNINKKMHEVLDVIKDVSDLSTRELYLGELSKRTNLSTAKLNRLMEDKIYEERQLNATQYRWPFGIKQDPAEVEPIVDEYGLFMDRNQIWMMIGDEKPFYFKSVSNFSIEFLQHIIDEKIPSKLVKVTNTKGRSYIFDAPSADLNSPQKFDDTISGYGNFLWNGSRYEFQKLRRYLFDRMGSGHKIETLGWQPDGFWAFNNKVIIPGSSDGHLNDDGILELNDQSYYIPSANSIYKNNPKRYNDQKKVRVIQSKYTFEDLAKQMKKVHREHAITALLHTISGMFSDIVFDKLNYFPLLFFYGPANTGKDELAYSMLSFFGTPQSPLSLSNGASTIKAKIAVFAQFSNMLVYLSEYTAGNQQMNEMLKDLWNRIGYKRRTLDSSVATEMVPILSPVVLTGNGYPDDEPLISRMIIEEITKFDFTAEEIEEFDKLDAMVKAGFSSITVQILQARSDWENDFMKKYKEVKSILKEKLEMITNKARMINNAAIYGACFKIMEDRLNFPFTWDEFLQHIVNTYRKQTRKMNIGSRIEKFWNIFLAAAHRDHDGLTHGIEYSISGDEIVVNITHVYNKVSSMWFGQYSEKAPNKADIMDMIKQDEDVFVRIKDSHRFGQKKSSGWVLKFSALSIHEDLLQSMEARENKQKSANSPKDNDHDQLPF